MKFENSKTQKVAKHRNSKCDKIKNLKCDKTQNSNCGITQNSKYNNSKTQNVTKLKKIKMWQKSKTQNVMKLKNLKCDKTLNSKFDTLLWHRCYYRHRSRDALSPICGIFFIFFTSVRVLDFQASFEPLPSFDFIDLCECYDVIWLDMILHLMFK